MSPRLIGPRLKGGSFYRKRPVMKQYATSGTQTAVVIARRRRAQPRVTGRLNAAIKRVMNSNLETKYVAQQYGITAPLYVPGDITPSLDYLAICPAVAQQAGSATSNTRCGEQIKPIRATCNVDLWFVNEATPVAKTVFVKAFWVSAKAVRAMDPTIVAPLPKGLLEDGTADPVSWVGTTGSMQRYYPVCKDNYTVHKIQTVKLVMNATDPISGDHPYPDGRSDRKSISFSWKPPTLKYNLGSQTFPQNHAPMLFLVAYSPGFIYPTDASLVNTVQYSYQVSMSFKDA